jgi:hypothetical protein
LIRRALFWPVLAVLAAALAVAGFWLLFSTFQIYDDEGYVLLSLRNFARHGGLYDQVYTQYGPFPYLLYDGLQRLLGFAFTNTTGRWITLVTWLGAAAASTALVAGQVRSLRWAAFTLAGVFTQLWVMINEPVHPGGLLALLVAVGAWSGAAAWEAGRLERFALVAALAGTAMAFTKINVGIFFLGAAFSWLALSTRSVPVARLLMWLVALGAAALPFALMRTLFAQSWVRMFAFVFAGGALSTLAAARAAARPVVTGRTWAWFAGGVLAAGAAIVALTLARHTSIRGLIDGIVLGPMKHPNVYFFAVHWKPGSAALALVSLALAGAATARGWWRHERFLTGVALARLLAAAVFLGAPFQLIQVSLADWVMSYGVSLAWLFVVPLRPDGPGATVRAWVALLLVFQTLHAYPVAGTQLNWGTFLWVPLLALGLHDAAPRLRELLDPAARWLAPLGCTVLIAATLTMSSQLARIGRRAYLAGTPLGVPGAENLRLRGDTAYAIRIMNQNLRAHADMLFSLPGLGSANLWTDLPAPTLANATHWFSLLSPAQQEEIQQRLAADPRSALLVQHELLDYFSENGIHPAGPLHDWLVANYETVLALDGYELRLRRGRTAAALSTARLQSAGDAGRELIVTLDALPRPAARIELCDFRAPGFWLREFTAGSTEISVQPIALDGRDAGPAASQALPLALDRPARVTLRLPAAATPEVMHGYGLVVLRDAAGAVIAEARLLD